MTEKDRALMCLMSTARYLTTEQARALRWPGRHESVAQLRLRQLAGIARQRPDGRASKRGVFQPPYLRRLWFLRGTGQRVEWWALSRHGESLAAELEARPLRQHEDDLGEPLREHWATLTDFFVALATPLLSRGTRATELPFRWDAQDSTALPWREYDAAAGKVRERLMVPDAVLELPGPRRRYLVECEMGTHSIVAASDEKAGATLRKTERYDEFFGGLADASGKTTFYRQAFPDGWPAEVLYLVRTPSRRDSVNAALETWRRGRGQVSVTARALTLDEATAEMSRLLALGPQPVPSTQPPGPAGNAGVDVVVLRRFYQEALLALRASGAPLPDSFRASALEARAVLEVRGMKGG